MRLIDADALYEKTAEWEARALAVVEKLNSKPFGEMDVDEITEWRKWSCVLNERSAFKHDVADAQTVEPQQWIPITERLPKKYIGEWLCCDKYGNIFILRYENTTPNGDCVFCYTDNDGYSVSVHDVVAWMPLPKPWEGEEDENDNQV